jgi:pyridoxal phosphate enzyme (YggS family)
MTAPQTALEARYLAVLARVRAISPAASLIAVSKGQPASSIEELYRLGHRDFGENYAQELADKDRDLLARGCDGIRWHFIGHLQTNKARQVADCAHAVHSVDSVKLARELGKRWTDGGRAGRLAVFIEVNLEGEKSKSGVDPGGLEALAARVAEEPGLDLRGLMCIPSPESAPGGAPFRELRRLLGTLAALTRGELSMGMTQDFEAALREGATHVRVGTAIFGPRGAVR